MLCSPTCATKIPSFYIAKKIDLPFNKKRAIYRWVSYTQGIELWRHEKMLRNTKHDEEYLLNTSNIRRKLGV